ncbi:MAG: amidohydrolase [Planctomycetota bacterium]
MRRPSRRAVLGVAGSSVAALAAVRLGLPRTQRPGPVLGIDALSDEARALVDAAFAGVERRLMWDSHAHLVGLGAGDTGAAVNPDMRSHLHPWKRLQFEIYLAAAGVDDLARADEIYRERLLALHRAANPEGRLLLLAFDWRVGPDGAEDPRRSTFYMPNERVLELAAQHADVEACVSIHPYRADAIERLELAAAAGARAVKWLPNAMGMDPASERCDRFYRKLVELGLVLVSHGGLEKAVHAEEDQELGNPLRLRRAIEHGARVVVAHCASTGTGIDLDDPGRGRAPCFDLFLRLLEEAGPEGTLYGDVSAMTQVNRCGDPLRTLLLRGDLHGRLVNGSDYPLPAIDLLVSTRLLDRHGYLREGERGPLNELFAANPLLFDFVLKRRLRVAEGGREHAFAARVFESGRLFG